MRVFGGTLIASRVLVNEYFERLNSELLVQIKLMENR